MKRSSKRELKSIVSASSWMRIRWSRRCCLRWVVMRAWLKANEVTAVRRRMGGWRRVRTSEGVGSTLLQGSSEAVPS